MAALFVAVAATAILVLGVGSALADPPTDPRPSGTIPGSPTFGAAIYADGQTWGTKHNADVPFFEGKNDQSFDVLYTFTNGVAGQLAVAEAAPGNPYYNGGRWVTMEVEWTVTPYLLTSYGDVQTALDAGDLEPTGAGSAYFQCPLLPDKTAD
jgi:hypothetical protein